MAVKPTPVFDTFRIGILAVFIRYVACTKGVSMVVKAKDAWGQILFWIFDIGVEGYKGDHGKMLYEPVSGIIVRGAVCNVVFEIDIGIKLPDFNPKFPISL
ncbi:MAG: hypothetical protein PHG58_03370 [Clostridia bacterium]|nr:hypothetical protein [Clostridia bacterium]